MVNVTDILTDEVSDFSHVHMKNNVTGVRATVLFDDNKDIVAVYSPDVTFNIVVRAFASHIENVSQFVHSHASHADEIRDYVESVEVGVPPETDDDGETTHTLLSEYVETYAIDSLASVVAGATSAQDFTLTHENKDMSEYENSILIEPVDIDDMSYSVEAELEARHGFMYGDYDNFKVVRAREGDIVIADDSDSQRLINVLMKNLKGTVAGEILRANASGFSTADIAFALYTLENGGAIALQSSDTNATVNVAMFYRDGVPTGEMDDSVETEDVLPLATTDILPSVEEPVEQAPVEGVTQEVAVTETDDTTGEASADSTEAVATGDSDDGTPVGEAVVETPVESVEAEIPVGQGEGEETPVVEDSTPAEATSLPLPEAQPIVSASPVVPQLESPVLKPVLSPQANEIIAQFEQMAQEYTAMEKNVALIDEHLKALPREQFKSSQKRVEDLTAEIAGLNHQLSELSVRLEHTKAELDNAQRDKIALQSQMSAEEELKSQKQAMETTMARMYPFISGKLEEMKKDK